jgi:hypothetical protein
MFRKSIFLGLTVMLSAVLIVLAIKARREETRAASVPAESLKTAHSTATRVIAPNDLAVAESKGGILTVAGKESPVKKPGARYQVTIRNSGRVAYHDTMLKFTCLRNDGKTLDTRSHLLPETIQPGQSLGLSDITLERLPRGTARCSISIVCASIGPAPAR